MPGAFNRRLKGRDLPDSIGRPRCPSKIPRLRGQGGVANPAPDETFAGVGRRLQGWLGFNDWAMKRYNARDKRKCKEAQVTCVFG